MRISDWSSDVCSSDLIVIRGVLFDAQRLVVVLEFHAFLPLAPKPGQLIPEQGLLCIWAAADLQAACLARLPLFVPLTDCYTTFEFAGPSGGVRSAAV